MQNFTMMVYDSRNTCIPYTIEAKSFSDARAIAQKRSLTNEYPVTIHDSSLSPNKRDWCKYENGQCYEATKVEYLTK